MWRRGPTRTPPTIPTAAAAAWRVERPRRPRAEEGCVAEAAAAGAVVQAEPPVLRAPRRALHGVPARRVAAAPHRRRRQGGEGSRSAAARRRQGRWGHAVLGLERGAAGVPRREPARGREIRAAVVARPCAREAGTRECSLI